MKPGCTSCAMMAPGWNVHLTTKAQEFYPAVCHFALNEPVCIPWWLDFMFREYENKKTRRMKEEKKAGRFELTFLCCTLWTLLWCTNLQLKSLRSWRDFWLIFFFLHACQDSFIYPQSSLFVCCTVNSHHEITSNKSINTAQETTDNKAKSIRHSIYELECLKLVLGSKYKHLWTSRLLLLVSKKNENPKSMFWTADRCVLKSKTCCWKFDLFKMNVCCLSSDTDD